MQPLVSAIVPTKNSGWILDKCLKSVKDQTYPNIELIVVDNSSTDQTKEIARKYTDLVFDKGPERNTQRPYAVSVSHGEFLLFIDSDMELPPTMVQSAVAKCVNEGADAVILPEVSAGNGFWVHCRQLEKQCFLNDPHMELANRFIRTQVYHAVGGYDLSLIGPEDFDIDQKIRRAGYEIARIDEPIKHYEEVSFFRMLKKYYLYGKYIPVAMKRYPKAGTRQYLFIRPAYVRNWKLFVKDPIHGGGLLVMHFFRHLAAGTGFVDRLIRKGVPR